MKLYFIESLTYWLVLNVTRFLVLCVCLADDRCLSFCTFSFGNCVFCLSSIYGGARVAQSVRSLDLTAHTSLSPIRRGFAPSFVNYKKGCTRLAAASDNVYQLLAQGRWFSPGTTASSTTKTGRHDIAEILLKVHLNTKIQIQIIFTDFDYPCGIFKLFLSEKYFINDKNKLENNK